MSQTPATSVPRLGFRKNVAALVEVDGLFLACERVDYAGSWQCVQGGVDPEDASLEAALLRELHEELGAGAEAFTILHRSRYWRRYLFPAGLPARIGYNHLGQDQLWFHVRLNSLSSVNLEASVQEFRSVKLVALDTLVTSFVHWKQSLLRDYCNEIALC